MVRSIVLTMMLLLMAAAGFLSILFAFSTSDSDPAGDALAWAFTTIAVFLLTGFVTICGIAVAVMFREGSKSDRATTVLMGGGSVVAVAISMIKILVYGQPN